MVTVVESGVVVIGVSVVVVSNELGIDLVI